MIDLNFLDIIVLVVYASMVVFIGFKTPWKKEEKLSDFLLAGRKITLPIFVATFVSTWYGGIMGVGEMTYRYGISNWIMQGLPYYIFGFLFAIFLAKKIRESNLLTIPDKLLASYDKKNALLGALLTFILVTPAPYILMVGVFLQLLFNINIVYAVIISALVSTPYLYYSGFKSDVSTDIFEFFIMFLGLGIILPFAIFNYGGYDFLVTNLPPLHLSSTGGVSIQYIIVWFFIALWTLIDPSFHQKCLAAKDPKVARNGILISIIFWFIFDFMTTSIGLYSKAILPNIEQPMWAYPLLGDKILPPIAKGFFYAGLLATIMSTLNSYTLISATTLGKDLYARFKSESDDDIIKKYIRISMIITTIFSIVIALLIPSVIDIWYSIGSAMVPGLLIPVVFSYFSKFKLSANKTFFIMLSGCITSTTCMIIGNILSTNGIANYPFGIEPMYVGLILTILLWVIFQVKFNDKFNE
jgi:SSS family solute:Na+ symporter